MKNHAELSRIVSSVLGSGKKIKDEEIYRCPFCHHRKPKLQVSVDRGLWQCWVCHSKGRSIYSLLKKMGVDRKVLDRVSELTKDQKQRRDKTSDESEDTPLFLPMGFRPIMDGDDGTLDYRHARAYLKRRGVTDADIIKYNIGYCNDGTYDGYLIIPSYDKDARLNYFVARAFYDVSQKYKNPPASKNVVMFDLHINWRATVTLVEGVFDAIAVKRNAIPLLGKFVPTELHNRIMETKPPELRIMLDSDARTDALKIAKRYMDQGFHVTLVDLPGKDPSDMGFEAVDELEPITMGFEALMRQKIRHA